MEAWLANQAKRISSGYDVQLTFDAIEALVDDSLPSSAREHRAWWANDASSGRQSRAWMNAGWRVEDVDFGSETVTFRRTDSVLYQLFFADLLEQLKQVRPGLTRATKAYPQNWWNFSGGRSGFYFGWTFSGGKELRTELYIDTGDWKPNKQFFDALLDQREEIEREFGSELSWQRLTKHRASRIYVSRPATVTMPAGELDEAKQWALESLLALVDTLQKRFRRL